jgi:hypothetical protein
MYSNPSSFRRQFVLFSLPLLLISAAACKQQQAGMQDDTYTFYYYPALNTYYNPQDNQFLYTLDGGVTWKRKPGSADIAANLDERITIHSEIADAWQNNEAHRSQYRGVYTNFTFNSATQEDSSTVAEVVAERPTSKPQPSITKTAEQQPEEKKKKGFRKLGDKIKKIFRKKSE